MGLGDVLKSIGMAFLEEAASTCERNKNEYNDASRWASRASDKSLKRQFKSSNSTFEKKAICDELISRGYGKK